jgi:hypothetical protein
MCVRNVSSPNFLIKADGQNWSVTNVNTCVSTLYCFYFLDCFPFEIVHCDVWTSLWLVFLVALITWFCWLISRIFVGPFHLGASQRCIKSSLILFVTFAPSSAFLLNAFRQIMSEFVNCAMHSLLAADGIVFHLSYPYTSPQNGKAEHVLRTLNNLVCTLLIHSAMPPSYWVKALAAATYLLNRGPSSSIGHEIPCTRLHKTPPAYEHLRIFGCLRYSNLQATAQHKLAPRSVACVFLGYPMSHEGYHCLDLPTRKIIISRHVVFNESTFPFTRDFLLDGDMDIVPCLTNCAARGTPTPADGPSSLAVECPQPFSGGRGPMPPQEPLDDSAPGGSSSVPPPGPSALPSSGGLALCPCQVPSTLLLRLRLCESASRPLIDFGDS